MKTITINLNIKGDEIRIKIGNGFSLNLILHEIDSDIDMFLTTSEKILFECFDTKEEDITIPPIIENIKNAIRIYHSLTALDDYINVQYILSEDGTYQTIFDGNVKLDLIKTIKAFSNISEDTEVKEKDEL